MSLPYTDFNQLKSDYISINGITDTFQKLIQNDRELVDVFKNKPEIWECRWYNDDSVQGYQKGDAVWLNTEDTSQFIEAKYDEICQYVLNSNYRGEFLQVSSDHDKTYDLFENICNGKNGYKRLFCLGQISADAQVMVSLSDDNKELPTNSKYWKSQFRLSSTSGYKDEILKMLEGCLDENLSIHIQNYHLSGMTLSYLLSTYLLNDFSNISKTQSLATHNLKNRVQATEGFDAVIKSHYYVDSSSNESKWFRLWKSGYLEHGGIISDSENATTPISINLEWTYTDGEGEHKAPVYDYPVQYDSFYAANQEIYVGGATKNKDSSNLGQQMTYNLVVTPLLEEKSDFGPDTTEIFNITNKGFGFSNATGNNHYSYKTSGFIASPALNKYLS